MNPAQEHSTIWLELRRLPQILFYVAAGRSNVARLGARGASGRMPLPRAGHPTARAVLRRESERSTQNGRAKTFGGWVGVVVVVVRTPTPNYLRQASQNLGKYSSSSSELRSENRELTLSHAHTQLNYNSRYTSPLGKLMETALPLAPTSWQLGPLDE